MASKLQKITLNIVGVFFICFGTFAMDYAIYRDKPSWIFWICYVAMVLIGFGALLKLPNLIASQLAIVGIPLLIWNIDFFYYIIFHHPLWGVTDYFFTEMLPASRLISFEHFFVIPLGVLALWLLKLRGNKFWLISSAQVVILYFIVRLFTNPAENVSCVFQSCATFIPNGIFYPLVWFGLMFLIITASSLIMNLLPCFKESNPPE